MDVPWNPLDSPQGYLMWEIIYRGCGGDYDIASDNDITSKQATTTTRMKQPVSKHVYSIGKLAKISFKSDVKEY